MGTILLVLLCYTLLRKGKMLKKNILHYISTINKSSAVWEIKAVSFISLCTRLKIHSEQQQHLMKIAWSSGMWHYIVCSSKTLVYFFQTIWCHSPEDDSLYSHCHGNLKLTFNGNLTLCPSNVLIKYYSEHYITYISHLIFQPVNYTLNLDTITDYRNGKEKNM
jgi:hypothetical protein